MGHVLKFGFTATRGEFAVASSGSRSGRPAALATEADVGTTNKPKVDSPLEVAATQQRCDVSPRYPWL